MSLSNQFVSGIGGSEVSILDQSEEEMGTCSVGIRFGGEEYACGGAACWWSVVGGTSLESASGMSVFDDSAGGS